MLFSFLLSLYFAVSFQPQMAESYSQDGPVIVIIVPTTPPSQGNRDLPELSISGYIDLEMEGAVLSFSSPCGIVTVRFNNCSTGYSYQTDVNVENSVFIPIPLSYGYWQVSITLPDGTQYKGDFEL